MNILLLSQNRIDSTSFYRANGVFPNLNKQMNGKLNITSMDFKTMKLDWADLMNYDIVFMQRPYNNMYKQLAYYVKELGIPLWIDYDDNLLNVPTDNKTFEIYSNKEIKKNISEFLAMADIISVSTNEIKNLFKIFNKNIKVIPNAFNQDLFKYRNIKQRKDVILWRGSDTHQLDLMTFSEKISSCANEFKNWKWFYKGYNPWFFANLTNEKIYYEKANDVIKYHQQIHNLAPKVMQVPLTDHLFNRCKSNIAALEGIFAGSVCIVPDWPEWQIPGTLKYNNPIEYSQCLKDVYHGRVKVKKNNDIAWQYINDVFSLEKVNKLRIKIIESLIN